MTEQAIATIEPKKVTLAESQKQSVATYGDNRAIAMEIKALRASIKSLKEVDDAGVAALVIASKWSRLNPYSGEIYYVPKLGVTIASKVKQGDAIAAAQKRGDTLTISYFKFDRNHPFFAIYGDPDMSDNDVASLVEIVSSKAHVAWLDMRIAKAREMKVIGYNRDEIEATLSADYGAPPVYRAVGYVKAAENFGEQGKTFVAFSRFDRAKKRALTKALNANGLSAPDQRQYGGVLLEADRDDEGAQFTIKPPAQIDEGPTWSAADDDASDAVSQPVTSETHAANQRKLGRPDDSGLIDDTPEPTGPIADAVKFARSMSNAKAMDVSVIAALKSSWTAVFRAANEKGIGAPVLDKPSPATLIAAIIGVGSKLI